MAGYDDMMGLEFGEFGAFLDGQMVRDALMASAAGGVGVLVGAWTMNKILAIEAMPDFVKNNRAVFKGLGYITLGIVGGRMLYDQNREASMGVLGGLGALGVANIINNFLGANAVGLSGDDDTLLSAGYNYDDSMAALAALEAPGVSTSPDAFSGFADPTVTPEALMGFEGPVVQQETLGYAPYLS